MALGRTITSASAVYALSIQNLYPVAQILQGFSADRAFETADTDFAETVMGVDGHMSGGYIPAITEQTISIMPDSLTSDMFELWYGASQSNFTIYPASATIIIPATGKTYNLVRGILKRARTIPTANKVLQAREFVIDWQRVWPSSTP
jgi:hypothetical protein